MFNSINSKFYAIAFLLTISFSFGYFILAYFQHQQNLSSQLAKDAILLERDISTMTELFYEARFWEKVIFNQANTEADMRFGTIIEKIRSHFELLERKKLLKETRAQFTEIAKKINQYEENIATLIQLKTKQSLNATRMDTNYRSMVSVILSSNNPAPLKHLFNFTHFLISYRSSRDLPKYQALKLVSKSLEAKIYSHNITDLRLGDYIKSFNQLLDENYELELEIIAINHKIENINHLIKGHLSAISLHSAQRLEKSLKKSDTIRENLQLLSLFSTVLGILFLLLILHIISRNIILPIRSIATVMQSIKGGDITARFASNKASKDEIVQFGFSFNEMLETLEANNLILIEYQKELELKIKEIQEREIESQRLTAQLQRVEKMEAIGTLAGGVAHDLNNILSGIVSYPELLLLELPEDSPYRRTVRLIQESGQKASAIVQDLLTLARRGVPVTEITNLNSLVSNYISSPEHLKLASLHPNVAIQVELNRDLFNISGSQVHLSKTIMNLTSNAVESIQGAGSVHIHTDNRYISEPIAGYDTVEQGDYAVLEIRDSGAGIARSDLDRIFEPFFTKKEMGSSGTGLGLAVVWGTVKDHNGYIDVQSVLGEGTTFTLYFPITREEIAENKGSSPLEELHGNGEVILVVDDIASQREIATSMLQTLGYAVESAASGEEAVQFMLKHQADALLLDMLMPPGIDGLETYKKILEIYPGQPAVIASGFSETERVKEAQKLGVAKYIKKPYSLETLGLALQEALLKNPG